MKKALLVFVVILVVLQAIRPTRNLGAVHGPQDITHVVAVPPQIENILQRACYDCHSNYTNYPWYANIQPLGWWLQHHINEGKEHFNMSELASLPMAKWKHKMHEAAEQVEEGEMPMESYTLIHKNARLTEAERSAIVAWAEAASK